MDDESGELIEETGITLCGGAKCRWGGSKSATFDK